MRPGSAGLQQLPRPPRPSPARGEPEGVDRPAVRDGAVDRTNALDDEAALPCALPPVVSERKRELEVGVGRPDAARARHAGRIGVAVTAETLAARTLALVDIPSE